MHCRAATVCGLMAVGCVSGPGHAYIDDLGMTSGSNQSAEIVAVDGEPEVRAKGQLATYIPYVLVEPGRHVFTAQSDDDRTIDFSSTVEAGKRYALTTDENGTLALEEQTSEQ